MLTDKIKDNKRKKASIWLLLRNYKDRWIGQSFTSIFIIICEGEIVQF